MTLSPSKTIINKKNQLIMKNSSNDKGIKMFASFVNAHEIRQRLLNGIRADLLSIKNGSLRSKCIKYEWNYMTESIQDHDTASEYHEQVDSYKASGFYIKERRNVALDEFNLVMIVFRTKNPNLRVHDAKFGLATGYLQADCELVMYELKTT